MSELNSLTKLIMETLIVLFFGFLSLLSRSRPEKILIKDGYRGRGVTPSKQIDNCSAITSSHSCQAVSRERMQ
jgi:hypothetical protein